MIVKFQINFSALILFLFIYFLYTICGVGNRTSDFKVDSISTMLVELCLFWLFCFDTMLFYL